MAKRDYHEKLTEVRVRFPSEDEERGIPDYLAIMRNRAKELGYIQPKGITKGEGNVTEYIMKLVERDVNGFCYFMYPQIAQTCGAEFVNNCVPINIDLCTHK